MAEHDQWRDRPGAGGSIERLDTALARIAAAAGRRQDALRVAELTARAAQHEADLLVQADDRRRHDVAETAAMDAAGREHDRLVRLRETADRLDTLIAQLRSELAEPPVGD